MQVESSLSCLFIIEAKRDLMKEMQPAPPPKQIKKDDNENIFFIPTPVKQSTAIQTSHSLKYSYICCLTDRKVSRIKGAHNQDKMSGAQFVKAHKILHILHFFKLWEIILVSLLG